MGTTFTRRRIVIGTFLGAIALATVSAAWVGFVQWRHFQMRAQIPG